MQAEYPGIVSTHWCGQCQYAVSGTSSVVLTVESSSGGVVLTVKSRSGDAVLTVVAVLRTEQNVLLRTSQTDELKVYAMRQQKCALKHDEVVYIWVVKVLSPNLIRVWSQGVKSTKGRKITQYVKW